MTISTGGRAVVQRLQAHGVEVTFGIPAQMNLALFDALLDDPPLRQVLARHELGAAYMADGYARATGRPGVLNVVGGPGFGNAFTGIAEARAASTPLLVLTTTVREQLLGQDRPTTHELPNQAASIDSIAAWRRRIMHAHEIEPAIDEAFERLAAGRPRPVVLEFTPDVLGGAAAPNAPVATRAGAPAPDDADISRAATLLASAQSPLIWAGGGANDASAAVRELAERLAAPVFTTDGSLGLLPDAHPLALGASWVPGDGVARLLEDADVVLAVGTTFSAYMTDDWTVPIQGRIIQIDVDPTEPGRNLPIELGLVGDASAALQALLALLPKGIGDRRRAAVHQSVHDARRAAKTVAAAEAVRRTLSRTGTVLELLDAVRSSLPPDGVVTVDSLIGYWVSRHFRTERPRTVQLAMQFGSLGYALPAAIGTAAARAPRPVAALAGDGAFMFTVAELGTAVQEQMPLPIIVYNDHGYGSIRWNQRRRYGRLVAADLVQPDFVALAQAFGARGVRVDSVRDVGPAMRDAFAARGPTLIEVELAIEPPYLS